MLKTVGLEPLRDALKPSSSAIRAAFVYGSVAKATDQSASDIDVMIIRLKAKTAALDRLDDSAWTSPMQITE